MKVAQCNALFNGLWGLAQVTLKVKGDDYARDQEDRLIQFKQMAFMEGRTPSEVAGTLLMKHVQSIVSAARAGECALVWEQKNGGEGLKQRIVDAMNYLLLMAACMEEQSTLTD